MGLSSQNRFLLFWSMLGAVAFLVIWHLPWRFQVNDDEVMMWLVSGAYTGTPESYAVFLHPVLSWCFAKLYSVAPEVKWYPWAWVLIMYSSFLVFVKLVDKRIKVKEFKILWTLFAFAFFIHFLFFLQFSIVAAIAVTVGLAARFSRDNLTAKSIFPEDSLILIGFLIRPEILLLFLIGIFIVQGGFFGHRGVVKRIFIPSIIWVFGIGLSWACFEKEGLQPFQEINQLRSQVFDHPALQLRKEELKDIDPQLYYFSNGLIDFHNNPELAEKLPHWKEFLDQSRWELLNFESVMLALSTFVFLEHFLLGLIGLFLVFAFFLNWKKAGLMFLFILGIICIAIPFYLLKVQIYGILFLFFFLIIFQIAPSIPSTRNIPWIFIFTLFIGTIAHFYSFFQSSKNQISAKILRSEMDDLRETGQIYLIGKGENYRDLLFDYPLGFRILGWPTLLKSQVGIEKSVRNIYFIDSATYFYNSGYFKTQQLQMSNSGLILLIGNE